MGVAGLDDAESESFTTGHLVWLGAAGPPGRSRDAAVTAWPGSGEAQACVGTVTTPAGPTGWGGWSSAIVPWLSSAPVWTVSLQLVAAFWEGELRVANDVGRGRTAPDGERLPQVVPTLCWEETSQGPAVVVLDQRRLPTEERSLVCRDVPTLVTALRTLAVRGAPVLGLAGAYGVALAAACGREVEEAARELAAVRPTAVNLARGVARALAAYRAALGGGADRGRAAAEALAEARAMHREDAEASERMAEHGLRLLRELMPGGARRILTHCNTGTLVSGGGGTAFAVARKLHEVGELDCLWIDETRPLLQGARLTAYEAAREGLPHRVLVDGAAGSLFAAGQVDAVLIGADRVAADGSVANKVGSYPLAVLAAHHRVPFIVVAPVTTVDLTTPHGDVIEIEERADAEVTCVGGPVGEAVPLVPRGTTAYNPAFDVTPPDLVTAIVTDGGVVSPVTQAGLSDLCPISPGEEPRSGNGMMSI